MNGALALDAHWFRCAATRVEVWCLAVDAIEPSVLVKGLGLLSDMERLRHMRFRFQADRDAYLAKRLLVRGALSESAEVAPGDWRFVEGPHGKPRIAEECGAAGLQFSLSRSGGLVVCGVSTGREMGVDVEDLARLEVVDVNEWVLSAEERERLFKLPQGERRAAFLRLWTLKEAYVKARGMGLSFPPAEVSFSDEPVREIGVRFREDAERWRFGQVTVLDRYVVATAVG